MTHERITKVFVKNLVLKMSVGIHDFEKRQKQRIVVNVEADTIDRHAFESDSIEDTVDYEHIVSGIKEIAEEGHINLLETFAARIAALCLEMPGVLTVDVMVEKPDIFPSADSVGVRIFREQHPS